MDRLQVTDLPYFLRDFGHFSEHLSDQFTDLRSGERGDAFLTFATRILPYTDFWDGFELPQLSAKKSHDKGVDFEASRRDGTGILCAQSKYRIREVNEFASVLSKFESYSASYYDSGSPPELFRDMEPLKPTLEFLIVTSSPLDKIVEIFQESRLSSKPFYQTLVDEGRLRIVDGPKLLNLLRTLYYKSFIIPTEIDVELETGFLQAGDVYLSVMSARTLRGLYDTYGSSLFFENIREFLGLSPSSTAMREAGVNDDIMSTLTQEPERMLERNNGVTFKAEAVTVISPQTLRLKNSSIVNGCQTTMCIVHSGSSSDQSRVPVKIVVASDSWDVAKAANYQNSVSRIDLDLARFLRPQLVRKIAADAGYGVPEGKEQTVSNVLDAIHSARVSYEGMRLLYIGFFSRKPNNLFDSNYNKLRMDVLQLVFENGKSEYFMKVLFHLLHSTEYAATSASGIYSGEVYADLFKRFFRDENYKYRSFLAVLSACGSVGVVLTEDLADPAVEYEHVLNFMQSLDSVLVEHRSYFERVFHLAFESLATQTLANLSDGGDSVIGQRMASDISRANFVGLFRMLRLRMDGDHFVREYVQANSLPLVQPPGRRRSA